MQHVCITLKIINDKLIVAVVILLCLSRRREEHTLQMPVLDPFPFKLFRCYLVHGYTPGSVRGVRVSSCHRQNSEPRPLPADNLARTERAKGQHSIRLTRYLAYCNFLKLRGAVKRVNIRLGVRQGVLLACLLKILLALSVKNRRFTHHE